VSDIDLVPRRKKGNVLSRLLDKRPKGSTSSSKAAAEKKS
jgi:putative ATP-binding cassette transporter